MKKLIILFIVIKSFLFTANAQWEPCNQGLPGVNITSLAISGNYLFAGTEDGVFLSTDNGNNWTQKNNGIDPSYIVSLVAIGNNILSSNNENVYLSTDFGESWVNKSSGTPENPEGVLLIDGDTIICYTINLSYTEIYRSTDIGNTWTSIPVGTEPYINTVAVFNGTIYKCTFNGIYSSNDLGESWIRLNIGTTNMSFQSILVDGNNIYAGTEKDGICISTDSGNSWSQTNLGLQNHIIGFLVKKDKTIFAGTKGSGLFISTDEGKLWTSKNNGIKYNTLTSIAYDSNNNYYLGTQYYGVYQSGSDLSSWKTLNKGFNLNLLVTNLDSSKNGVYAEVPGGLFKSPDNGDNWYKISPDSNDINISGYIISGDSIYLVENDHEYNNYWYFSNDDGIKWTHLEAKLDLGASRLWMLLKDNNIFVLSHGVYVSTDDGINWTKKNNGITNQNFCSFKKKGNNLYVCSYLHLFISSDNGDTWLQKELGLNDTAYIKNMSIEENYIFIGTLNAGAFVSTDNGDTWKSVNNGLPGKFISASITYKDNIFVGIIRNGVYLSKDRGENWTECNAGLNYKDIYKFTFSNGYIFAGTASEISITSDEGATWLKDNPVLSVNDTKEQFMNGYLGDGIYRARLSDFGISDVPEVKPGNNELTISPNPATDHININVGVQNFEPLKNDIRIYNTLGEIVYSVGANGRSPLHVDVSGFAPGVYFLKVGNETKMFVKI